MYRDYRFLALGCAVRCRFVTTCMSQTAICSCFLHAAALFHLGIVVDGRAVTDGPVSVWRSPFPKMFLCPCPSLVCAFDACAVVVLAFGGAASAVLLVAEALYHRVVCFDGSPVGRAPSLQCLCFSLTLEIKIECICVQLRQLACCLERHYSSQHVRSLHFAGPFCLRLGSAIVVGTSMSKLWDSSEH